MIHFTLNGEAKTAPAPITIVELLEGAGLAGRRVAVEVNRDIVPRSRHGEHRVEDGDRVEIVQAIGGG
jgi:sulfur carrier protein